MNSGSWHFRLVCPECDKSFGLWPSGAALNLGCCPGCGLTQDRTWETKTMRFMPCGVWYKPWTWWTGTWETRYGG